MDTSINVEVRQLAMSYAVQTAELGEDPLRILARAQLYAEFILSDFCANRAEGTHQGPHMVVEADNLSANFLK